MMEYETLHSHGPDRPHTAGAYTNLEVVDRAYLVIDVLMNGDDHAPINVEDDFYLRAHLDSMGSTIDSLGGEVVRILSDELEAVFTEPAAAFAAAISFLTTPSLGATTAIKGLRLALTFGSLIQSTVNGRTDYFGRDVILGSAMARASEKPGIGMSVAFAKAIGLNLDEAGDAGRVKFAGLNQAANVHEFGVTEMLRHIDEGAFPSEDNANNNATQQHRGGAL